MSFSRVSLWKAALAPSGEVKAQTSRWSGPIPPAFLESRVWLRVQTKGSFVSHGSRLLPLQQGCLLEGEADHPEIRGQTKQSGLRKWELRESDSFGTDPPELSLGLRGPLMVQSPGEGVLIG